MSDEGQTHQQYRRSFKILFSYEGGFPLVGYGGGHQIVRGLARACTQLGHEVRVLLGGSDEIGASAEDSGVTYRPLCSDSRWRFTETGRATIVELLRWRPDVVCCFTAELVLLAPVCRMLRVPLLTYLADPQLLDLGISASGLRNARIHIGQVFQRLGCIGTARVTTISDYTSRQAVEIWKLAPGSVVTVGTGLHDAYFQTSARASARTRGAPLRIVSIGRLALAQKPLDLVARALQRSDVPWALWTIIGTGSDADALTGLLTRLGISDRVRLVGFMKPHEIVHELARHDVVVLPSRRESFFMTPYEAIARSRVVVTNDVAEVKSILGSSHLFVLASDQTVEAYAAAIGEAWKRLNESDPTDQAASQLVRERYSWQGVAERFIRVIDDVVTG